MQTDGATPTASPTAAPTTTTSSTRTSGVRHYTASAVVLDDHSRVLVVHHNKVGLWLYPGGHIDPNEDPAQAAVREVLEETGVKVVALGTPTFQHPAIGAHLNPWAIIEGPVRDNTVGEHHHIDFIYVCRAASSGELNAALDEVSSARWIAVTELADLPTPPELPDLVAAAAAWANTQC